MARFPFHLFEHFPPRFITIEELFAHLPLVQRGHQRLNEHRDALQPIGERTLGQRQAVMRNSSQRRCVGQPWRYLSSNIIVQTDTPQRAFRDHTGRGGL